MGALGAAIIIIIIIAVLLVVFGLLAFSFNIALGQTVAPPKETPPAATPPTPPAAATPPVAPTVTNTPTPTAPSPNLQYLPQKAYVQSYAPEIGVPANTVPLQAVPPVIAPSVQQQSSGGGFDMSTIMSVISMIMAGGSGFLGKMGLDKAKNVQGTVQQVAQNNVQQAQVQQKTLETVYEQMPDKGASITDKPEIKLENVAKIKEDALKLASKA